MEKTVFRFFCVNCGRLGDSSNAARGHFCEDCARLAFMQAMAYQCESASDAPKAAISAMEAGAIPAAPVWKIVNPQSRPAVSSIEEAVTLAGALWMRSAAELVVARLGASSERSDDYKAALIDARMAISALPLTLPGDVR